MRETKLAAEPRLGGKKLFMAITLVLGAFVSFSSLALDSQVAEGVLVGRVRLAGAPPPAPPPTRVKPADMAVCGSHKGDEGVVLGSDGALQNVIVHLEGLSTSPSPRRDAKNAGTAGKVRVTNRNCQFQPHVQTATVGSTLIVGNDDNILHNTHGYLNEKTTLFNVGLPFQGVEVSRPLARPGMVSFKCDAGHTWMSGYLLVLDHLYHAVTDSSGRFRIASVPPGVQRVRIWHEKFGAQTQNVEIKPGQETAIAIQFKTPSN